MTIGWILAFILASSVAFMGYCLCKIAHACEEEIEKDEFHND